MIELVSLIIYCHVWENTIDRFRRFILYNTTERERGSLRQRMKERERARRERNTESRTGRDGGTSHEQAALIVDVRFRTVRRLGDLEADDNIDVCGIARVAVAHRQSVARTHEHTDTQTHSLAESVSHTHTRTNRHTPLTLSISRWKQSFTATFRLADVSKNGQPHSFDSFSADDRFTSRCDTAKSILLPTRTIGTWHTHTHRAALTGDTAMIYMYTYVSVRAWHLWSLCHTIDNSVVFTNETNAQTNVTVSV